MSSEALAQSLTVPGQRTALEPPSPRRIRAFKRHLIDSIRDFAAARRPERLIQRRSREPEGFVAEVVAAACGHCRGSCCMAGGTHAFIDERTMARLHAERPDLRPGEIIRTYVRAIAGESYQGSCLFHGPRGCTLDRRLRAELCNLYYCSGLEAFVRSNPVDGGTVTIKTHDGEVIRCERPPNG